MSLNEKMPVQFKSIGTGGPWGSTPHCHPSPLPTGMEKGMRVGEPSILPLDSRAYGGFGTSFSIVENELLFETPTLFERGGGLKALCCCC